MTGILNNPHVRAAVAHETAKDKLVGDMAEQLMSAKVWRDMSKNERKICVRYIVSQVESEDELRERLTDELNIGYCAISWHLSGDGDKTGDEARALVKAMGGLVAKNGALVQIMTVDDMF